eukprot:3244392-Ditylum_brightwellii.AAC.3
MADEIWRQDQMGKRGETTLYAQYTFAVNAISVTSSMDRYWLAPIKHSARQRQRKNQRVDQRDISRRYPTTYL